MIRDTMSCRLVWVRRAQSRPYLLLALSLIAIMLSGCIMIPAPGLLAVRDVSGKVGGPTSGAPLRVGINDREDVRRVLGKPNPEMSVYNDWIYSNDHIITGYTIWLVPLRDGQFETNRSSGGLRINFQPNGKISGYSAWR